VVDLPAPLGPSRPKTSPARTSRRDAVQGDDFGLRPGAAGGKETEAGGVCGDGRRRMVGLAEVDGAEAGHGNHLGHRDGVTRGFVGERPRSCGRTLPEL